MGLLRRLFGPKRTTNAALPTTKEKRRWNFGRSNINNHIRSSNFSSYEDSSSMDPNKHAIAVATATAAVAEAALAAAQAAAEVVRLTSGGTVTNRCASTAGIPGTSSSVSISRRRRHEETSALVIQSAFRGYLARRALRALKALVKLQALVRGHMVRKQTADMLRRMQTLVKVQARARASRTHLSKSSIASSHSFHHRYPRFSSDSLLSEFADVEKVKANSTRLDQWREESLWNKHKDEDESDKILEIDTWEPNSKSMRNNSKHYLQKASVFDYKNSIATDEASSRSSLNLCSAKDEAFYRTVESSPQMLSGSSRPVSSHGRSPFTPTRSESSWGYAGHPNYMANTKSSRAKVRSHSAPRQRVELDKCGSSKRCLQGLYDGEAAFSGGIVKYSNECKARLFPPSGGGWNSYMS